MSEAQSSTLLEIWDQFRWHWRSWDDIKGMSWFSKVNYVNIYMFIGFVAFAIYQARRKVTQSQDGGPNKLWLAAPAFPDINQLPDFSWKDEQPLKLRLFRPKYHLTMALQKLDPSEYLLMDNTYADRLNYRSKIIREHPNRAVMINDDKRVGGAVRELYTWLLGTYLPRRYPTMFKLHHAVFENGDTYMLENLVTKAMVPARAELYSNTYSLLETLGRTVDEDFLFLLPEEVEAGKESDAKYVLEALVCVGPSGWDPREKIGKRLASIHTPVPGYQKILEGSMDRYFAKAEAGDYIKRSNWTITMNEELFAYDSASNHAKEGEEVEVITDIDPEKVYLRCERQTLHRLPKSKAMVFAFKTYMNTIKEIREEGLGDELATAIEGMKEGNTPKMYFYKRGASWGEAVKKYLRS